MDSEWVLPAVSPTVLTPASPLCDIAWWAHAPLPRRLAVRSAPWGSPSAVSHSESSRRSP